MAGMNATQIINKCKELIESSLKDYRYYKATVTSITESGIFVKYAWSNVPSTIPVPKLKHVSVNVGDLVLMSRLNGSYIILGVIE